MLVIVMWLIVLGALSGCSRDNATSTEANSGNGGIPEMTEKHNSGWRWAERGKVKTATQCQELEDLDERDGCEAYVIFVSAQNATSP